MRATPTDMATSKSVRSAPDAVPEVRRVHCSRSRAGSQSAAFSPCSPAAARAATVRSSVATGRAPSNQINRSGSSS